jgi:retron-type reverse transcriptase
VDRLTWTDYEAGLERRLEDLYDRVQRGAYRALPSRRVYIPKPDGRQRPLAVAALEDKIVQRAVVALLNAIYEEDFLGNSYGFRPGRGTHDALASCGGRIRVQPLRPSEALSWNSEAPLRRGAFFVGQSGRGGKRVLPARLTRWSLAQAGHRSETYTLSSGTSSANQTCTF